MVCTACDPVRDCARLIEAEDYEAASVRCEEVYRQTGDARAGVASARAHYFLGNRDRVLAWDELTGSAEEAQWLRLAAAVHSDRGHLELARVAYRRELDLHRAAGDHRWAANSLYALYYIAWQDGEYRAALDLARQAWEKAVEADHPATQARVIEGLFATLHDVGDLAGARKALAAARELSSYDDPDDRARLLLKDGLLRLGEGRMELARDLLEQALELGTEVRARSFHRSANLNLVDVHLALGDLDAAQHHLETAWSHADPEGSRQSALRLLQARLDHARGDYPAAVESLMKALEQEQLGEWRWNLEYQLGQAEEAAGDLAAAEAAYRRASAVVEDMRRHLGVDELKVWLLEDKRRVYEALFRLQARADRDRDALVTIERAKARTFLDAFIDMRPNVEVAGDEPWAAAIDRLDALQTLLPAMSASEVVAPRPLDEVLASLEDRHVLVYFEAGDELWLTTVAAGGKLSSQPLASTDETRSLVQRYQAAPERFATSVKLATMLLPPDSLPAPGTTLYVVADGALGRLPFAALRHRERYLVEDYAIAYVPSLTALVALSRPARTDFGPPVVLGDPRGDLPAAGLEARDVAARLAVAAVTGDAATTRALHQAAASRVLHLATHSGLGARGPWLQLADGEVTASDVVAGRLAPRLVVLASCASAARHGSGMWGSLGAAFLAAGSGAALASLWSIEDSPTRGFVAAFYRHGGAVDAAGALARAQRELIAAGQSPSSWAPFVLFGSDRPRDRGR